MTSSAAAAAAAAGFSLAATHPAINGVPGMPMFRPVRPATQFGLTQLHQRYGKPGNPLDLPNIGPRAAGPSNHSGRNTSTAAFGQYLAECQRRVLKPTAAWQDDEVPNNPFSSRQGPTVGNRHGPGRDPFLSLLGARRDESLTDRIRKLDFFLSGTPGTGQPQILPKPARFACWRGVEEREGGDERPEPNRTDTHPATALFCIVADSYHLLMLALKEGLAIVDD